MINKIIVIKINNFIIHDNLLWLDNSKIFNPLVRLQKKDIYLAYNTWMKSNVRNSYNHKFNSILKSYLANAALFIYLMLWCIIPNLKSSLPYVPSHLIFLESGVHVTNSLTKLKQLLSKHKPHVLTNIKQCPWIIY